MGIARESVWLGSLCLADMLWTVWLIRSGLAIEANPILSFYLNRGLITFVAVKSLLFVGPLLVLEWVRRRRPRFVQAMLRLAIALYLGSYCAGIWRINRVSRTGSGAETATTVPHSSGRSTPLELGRAERGLASRRES